MKGHSLLIRRYGFVALVTSLIISLQVLPGPRSVDDAYITFRYARNLATGQGFVYNIDQHVLGTTTPMFTLLLAALKMILPGLDFPWLALLISAACDVVAIVLLRRLVQALTQSTFVATMIAFAYLLNPVRIGVALGGMETSLVVMWLVATSEAYVAHGRVNQAALFSGFAVLTRPDAILLPALMAVYELFFRRHVLWKAGLIFSAVLAPWLIFAQSYFGSPLPTSVVAKSQAYITYRTQALTSIMDFLVTRAPFSSERAPLIVIGFGLVLLFGLYIIGARTAVRARQHAWPLVLFPMFYVGALSAANPWIFVWYYPPLMITVDTLCLIGLASLLRPESSHRRQVLFGMGVAIVLIVLPWLGLRSVTRDFAVDFRDRELVYKASADEMRSTIPPGSRVALPEIGVWGYVLDRVTIIDTVGLVSPDAIPYLRKERTPGQTFIYAISNEVIAALKPDYIVTLEIFARPTLLQSSEFSRNYQLVQT